MNLKNFFQGWGTIIPWLKGIVFLEEKLISSRIKRRINNLGSSPQSKPPITSSLKGEAPNPNQTK